jgi:thiol-disulfide isomerase/thioredoxin
MRLVVTALALAVLALLVYRMWEPFVPSKPKKEVPVDTATLYFFYTDWCGFCQKAKPEIEKLEKTLGKNSTFGTTKVTLMKVNAEEDRARADEYEVDAYPTVKLETPEGLYEFKKGVTEAALLDFLRKSLGKEASNSK